MTALQLKLAHACTLGALCVAFCAGFDDEKPAEAPPAAAAQDPSTASKPALPAQRRVHIIVDRKTELGGTVVYEDESQIVIERDGKRSEFKKDQIIEAIPLLDVTGPTLVTVYWRDGTAKQVELLADDYNEVRYAVGNVTRSIPRAEVYRLALVRAFEDRYRDYKKSIEPEDYARWLALCDWLVDERRYVEAQSELVALVDKSKLPEAVALLKHVSAQVTLMQSKERTKPDQPALEATPTSKRPTSSKLPTRILTDDEVNIIRVYELDFDAPSRVAIASNDIRAFLDAYNASAQVPPEGPARNALVDGDPMKIVQLAFDLKARDFYPKIRVLSEPPTLNLFRRKVHDAWLIGNCATSGCHGGENAGRFFLFQQNDSDVRVRYANLLNLLMGTSNDLPLVDFNDPLKSVVIQHALPTDEATNPHPKVDGWRPAFGRKVHPDKLAQSLAWIRSMYQPRPVYPIDYRPPDLRPVDGAGPADPDEPSR